MYNCARCSTELYNVYSLRCKSCPLRLCLKCHNHLNQILCHMYGPFETEQDVVSKPQDFGHRRALSHTCWKCREEQRVINRITAFLDAHNKTRNKAHGKKTMKRITAFLDVHNKTHEKQVMNKITAFLETHNRQKNEN